MKATLGKGTSRAGLGLAVSLVMHANEISGGCVKDAALIYAPSNPFK